MRHVIITLANVFFLLFSSQIHAQLLSEDFEGVTTPNFPPGWAVTNDGSGNQWHTYNNSTYARSGSIFARYNYSSSYPADTWFFTGSLSLNAGSTYNLSFWYRARSSTWEERMEVYICTGQTSADTVAGGQLWDNNNIVNITYLEANESFSPPSTGIYYIGFHCYSLAYKYDLCVDDITIEEIVPYNLNLTTLTPDTTIAPGEVCYHSIEVENKGSQNDTYNLVVNGGGSWTYEIYCRYNFYHCCKRKKR